MSDRVDDMDTIIDMLRCERCEKIAHEDVDGEWLCLRCREGRD